MPKIKDISNSLEQTLKNSDLQNVTISLSEVIVDNFMNEGIYKDIPILSTIAGLGKSAIGIKEMLLLKKVIWFIYELRNIDASKRLEMIEKIEKSKKYKIKLGEKLLYIIDKCEDHEKSQIIAILFSAFIKEVIKYDEFLKASHIINNLMIDDLKWFVEQGWEKESNWKYENHWNYEHGYVKIDFVSHLAISGLFEIISPEISVKDQWDHKADNNYIVEGSDLFVRITDIGKAIKNILKEFFL